MGPARDRLLSMLKTDNEFSHKQYCNALANYIAEAEQRPDELDEQYLPRAKGWLALMASALTMPWDL